MQNAVDCVDAGQAYVVQANNFFGDVAQFKNVADFFVVALNVLWKIIRDKIEVYISAGE